MLLTHRAATPSAPTQSPDRVQRPTAATTNPCSPRERDKNEAGEGLGTNPLNPLRHTNGSVACACRLCGRLVVFSVRC